jgi:hypothetical protein
MRKEEMQYKYKRREEKGKKDMRKNIPHRIPKRNPP